MTRDEALKLEAGAELEVLERYTEGGQEIVVVGKRGQMMPSPMDMIRQIQDGLNKGDRDAVKSLRYTMTQYGSGPPTQPVKPRRKVPGRNDPCHCGSGRKYKKCCGVKANH